MKLTTNMPSGDVAVFNSAHVFPSLTASHNVVYVRFGSDAACDAELVKLFDLEVRSDPLARKLVCAEQEWDIVNVSHIYPEYVEEAARTGGVVNGDAIIDHDTTFENGLVVCGTLTICESVTLTVNKGEPLIAEDAVINGTLLYNAPDFGFKPGHVVGPDAQLDPERIHVCGNTLFASNGARIAGTGVSFYTLTARIKNDACFTGMITFDELTIDKGVDITAKDGCWLNWIHATLEDNVTFHVSETEICVLEYTHHDKNNGYYDHTGFGTTRIGENVQLLGDDTFCWFWMGDLQGRFADVRGNIVMKAKQLVQVNEGDLRNVEVSEIHGNGTPDDPFAMTYHVRNEEYPYVTSRSLAVDAAVNNVIQARFPNCVLFDYWGKRVLGFKNLRAGNILIHRVDDVETLLHFADIVVYAKEI